jgi:hypothetical protein
MPYEPNREAQRIAAWLIANNLGDFAKRVLAGEHWAWNPNETARFGSNKNGHGRTGPRR